MNFLRGTFCSMLLVPTLAYGHAQNVGKPVLSAAPAPPPPAVATTPAAAGTPTDPSSYVIGADDTLQIIVWKEPQLSTTLPVRPDGKISLSLIHDVVAAGLTPMQLQADLTDRLKKFLTDPVVDVTVMAVNSKHVYMVGEIGRAGPLAIAPGMTVLQAIATAGGVTAYANKKHIYILRGEPGKQKKLPFDYEKALKKGDMQGVTLEPGDTIVVP